MPMGRIFAILGLSGQDDLDRNLRHMRFELAAIIILPGR